MWIKWGSELYTALFVLFMYACIASRRRQGLGNGNVRHIRVTVAEATGDELCRISLDKLVTRTDPWRFHSIPKIRNLYGTERDGRNEIQKMGLHAHV